MRSPTSHGVSRKLSSVWPTARPYGNYYWVNPDALRTDDRPVDIFDRPGVR